MLNFNKKRVLVTGGAGFLGSHLCEYYLNQGHEVVCMDNFATGHRKNILPFLNNSDFELVRHDVSTPISINVDMILNMACAASPVQYQRFPVETTVTSVMGAINMLETAKRLDIPVFQASTSEVYGDPKEHPQKETYAGYVNPIGVRACYDEGKRCAETLFFDYHREHNVNIKVGRIFNTYGPRMRPEDGRMVSNFIMQALHNEEITVYGDGSQTRSLCFYQDLIDAITTFMDTEQGITGPLNMGNDQEVTVLQVAELIKEISGSSSPIVFKDLPEDDPVRRCPDLIQIKNELDWKPKVSLEKGLQETIEYYEDLISSSSVGFEGRQ